MSIRFESLTMEICEGGVDISGLLISSSGRIPYPGMSWRSVTCRFQDYIFPFITFETSILKSLMRNGFTTTPANPYFMKSAMMGSLE